MAFKDSTSEILYIELQSYADQYVITEDENEFGIC